MDNLRGLQIDTLIVLTFPLLFLIVMSYVLFRTRRAGGSTRKGEPRGSNDPRP